MSRPTLYLFVGYPGAGKTTVAKVITEATGGIHLWADAERHIMFGAPTHSHDESLELYKHLNKVTDDILSQGRSVIFDTNFNFRKDRDFLRSIADKYGIDTVVVWLTTDRETARDRAVSDSNLRNGYQVSMNDDQFDALTSKLEKPGSDEHVVRIDGTDTTPAEIRQALGLAE